MVQLSFKPRRDQRPLLDVCATSASAVRTAPIATTRPPLPLGAPARSVAVLAGLRAEAPVQPRTLGLRRPTAPTPVPARPAPQPLPSRDLIEYVTAVSTAIHADYERHLDTLRVIDEISAAAPDTHTLRMALTPILAQLALYDTKAGYES